MIIEECKEISKLTHSIIWVIAIALAIPATAGVIIATHYLIN